MRSGVRRANVRDAGGFTLVETIVATALLTTGLVAMAQLLAVSLQMHDLGRRTAEASFLAEDKFEEFLKLDFTTAAELQISPGNPNPLAQNVTN